MKTLSLIYFRKNIVTFHSFPYYKIDCLLYSVSDDFKVYRRKEEKEKVFQIEVFLMNMLANHIKKNH